MPDPTPGQVAYEAFWSCVPGDGHWVMLDAGTPARWEAAAPAVLTMHPIVHLLRAGQVRCGFTQAPPVQWPEGHLWSAQRREVTCPDCLAGVTHG